MASRLLLRVLRRALPGGWRAAAPARAMSVGGIPSDEEQATGLERKTLEAMKKGQVRRTTLLSFGSGCMQEKASVAHHVVLTTSSFIMMSHIENLCYLTEPKWISLCLNCTI
ncbi:uncharacterized protein LOC119858892 isoform X2 [Dermochelys coriacea]|uniref:uncharacterized protein LOC119858892 isoform X2 n=1 Tax=Dermochelys coriacea TaxID=27794 RepID=UPI0018E8E726|nr:uncharacterized protein LOC119858892 isoform X2 [Dermochelys coriacea]